MSRAIQYPKMTDTNPVMEGTAWNFVCFSALFSNRTKSIREDLKRNLLLDSDNMIIIAKTKHAVFIMAFRLKNGISELLTVKSSNSVMPNTMPL